MNFNRLASRLGLLLLGAFLPGLRDRASAADLARRPNVLIILADDLGYSDLGCYGGEIETPNLDQLAQNGLQFTQFYNTGRCWPTRAALLTGFYAQQVRRDSIPDIPSGVSGTRPGWARLLPELLRQSGYRSYHSGKWHVDGSPLQTGFDRSYSLNDHNRYFAPREHTLDDRPLPAIDPDAAYYATTAIADHAIQCLRDHAAQDADKPFFQFLAFTAPHFPLHALPDDIAKYREVYRRGWDEIRQARWQRIDARGLVRGSLSEVERDVGPPYEYPDAMKKLGPGEVNRPVDWQQLTAEQREFQATKMAVHAAMVDRMDREIGRVLAQIRSMGAWENTWICFLSDNGASAEIMVRGDGHDPAAPAGSAPSYLSLGPGWSTVANTPFRRHKTWTHEGGIATPFIVHWPAAIQDRGELRHSPGHVIDIVPTILEMTGTARFPGGHGPTGPALPGESLVPLFSQDRAGGRESLWWLHEDNRAVRSGDWKLVAVHGSAAWELFDLSLDRAETKDLASRFPEKVRALEQAWQIQWDNIRRWAAQDLLMK